MKRVDIGRKVEQRRNAALNEARVIEENGGFALVLELVDPSPAAEITQSGSIPTIGTGSGTCDGQILVFHDLVGYFPLVERFGHLDAAVNNAGTEGKSGPVIATFLGSLPGKDFKSISESLNRCRHCCTGASASDCA